MVSLQMLFKGDHRQALGGYVHLPPTFIFPHPQGATGSQSKALWDAVTKSRSQQHGTNTE